ncbi:hypothetical protein CC2G_014290 [Coprinopsis cinerea AmutBmut pab1-1]|nr:hypothetical protein CC2G_014290 [Coprinopsis cinerea AmutBmut pab1-1]
MSHSHAFVGSHYEGDKLVTLEPEHFMDQFLPRGFMRYFDRVVEEMTNRKLFVPRCWRDNPDDYPEDPKSNPDQFYESYPEEETREPEIFWRPWKKRTRGQRVDYFTSIRRNGPQEHPEDVAAYKEERDAEIQVFKSFEHECPSNYRNGDPEWVAQAWFRPLWDGVRDIVAQFCREDGVEVGFDGLSIRCPQLPSEWGRQMSAAITTNLDTKSPMNVSDVVFPATIMVDDCDQVVSDSTREDICVNRTFQILNDDVRRKSVFGLSVFTNFTDLVHPDAGLCISKLTLWYCTDGCAFRSEAINLREDPDLAIAAILSLLEASQTTDHDPLITSLPNGNYLYELPPAGDRAETHYYRTLGLLSSPYQVYRCRVWKVEQVISKTDLTRVPGTSDMVLKDVYSDAEKRTEDVVQGEVFRDIGAFGRDKNWRQHPLLKALDDDDMDALGEALEGDRWKKFFTRIIAHHIGESVASKLPEKAFDRDYDLIKATRPRRTPFPLGRQCRYVYDAVCTPLPNIPTLGVAIDVIKQVLIPLRLMFCAGWVHRDINPDNILAYRPSDDAPWSVKLSDLKFAMKFPVAEIPPKDEIIIGTPGFMACEVQLQQHTSPPITIDKDVPCEDYLRKFHEAQEKLDLFGPVLQTYQHEFESIWWVMMWETTFRVFDRPDTNENIFLRLADPDTVYWKKSLWDEGIRVYNIHAENRVNMYTPYNGVPVASTLEGFIVALDKLVWAFRRATYKRNEAGLRRKVEAYADVVGSKHWKAFWGAVEESREQWGEELLMVDSEVWDRARTVAKELGSRVYEFVPLTVQEMQKVEVDAEESKVKKPVTKKKGSATKQKGSTTKKKSGDATTKEASDAAKKKAGDATKQKGSTSKKKAGDATTKKASDAAKKKLAGDATKEKVGDTTKKKVGDATKKKVGDTTKKKAGNPTTKKASDAAKKKPGDATNKKVSDTTKKNARGATKKTRSKTVSNKETVTAASEKKAGSSKNSKKRKADENGDDEDRKRGAKRARVGSK